MTKDNLEKEYIYHYVINFYTSLYKRGVINKEDLIAFEKTTRDDITPVAMTRTPPVGRKGQ